MKLFQIKQVYLVLAWNFNLFMVANRLNGFAESLRFLLGLFLVCLPEFCVREYGPIRNFIIGHRLVSVKKGNFCFLNHGSFILFLILNS